MIGRLYGTAKAIILKPHGAGCVHQVFNAKGIKKIAGLKFKLTSYTDSTDAILRWLNTRIQKEKFGILGCYKKGKIRIFRIL